MFPGDVDRRPAFRYDGRMGESLRYWFGCLGRRRSLFIQINLSVVPVLCCVMLFVTGVAVMYGHHRSESIVHNPEARRIFWENVAVTGFAEFFGLVAGVVAVGCLTRRIGNPIRGLADGAVALMAQHSGHRLDENESIEEFRQLACAFNRLLDERHRRVEELSFLSGNLLHDIRTPLSAIRNESELALRGERDCEEALQGIFDSSENLLAAVATNAEISLLASGESQGDGMPVDLNGLVRATVAIFQSAADAKGVAIRCKQTGGCVWYRGHKRRLQQLVSNLVDHAVKFTPVGGEVSVEVEESASAVAVRVADTGIGIRGEDKGRVFERYFRADASRRTPGFGLGLSLVKAIADSYGGSVECVSERGRGSVFTARLPRGSRRM